MSTKHEITGRLIVLNDTQTFGSGFQKREFVITTADEKFAQDIKFEAIKDGCAKLDAFKFGDTLKVSFNIRGNEYNGKYYVSLQAWKIEKESDGAQDAHNQAKSNGYQPERRDTAQNGAAPPSQTATADGLDEADDIPF
jgi:hypothetical protein